jgi:hypothetical protein
MTLEQAQDCQEIVHWCAKNVGRMQSENKTQEEITRACLNHISPHDETCIHPDVVRRYVGTYLSWSFTFQNPYCGRAR